MQSTHLKWMRQRKLSLYESLMRVSLPIADRLTLEDDVTYVRILDLVASKAPLGFGLTVGASRRLADLGLLGTVTLGCSTLREVLDLWMVFSGNVGEPITLSSSFSMRDADEVWTLEMTPDRNLPAAVSDLLCNELAASFFSLGKEMCGGDLSAFDVVLPHGSNADVDYTSIFARLPHFEGESLRISGPATFLETPVTRDSAPPLDQHAYHIKRLNEEAFRSRPTAQALYDYLVRERTASPKLDHAAAALKIGPRTLVRRLASEGTRFGEVVSDFRRDYALALARHADLKAKQIAHLVGFHSENGLRKAFKHWTGTPIGSWQKMHRD